MEICVFDKLLWRIIGPKGFLFGTAIVLSWARDSAESTVNYDYIVPNSINFFSRCIPNGIYTNHCRAKLAHTSKHVKNSDAYIYVCVCVSVFCAISELQIALHKLKS